MGVQAQARCGEEARATRPQQRSSSTAHLLAPRILAAEAGFRRFAHHQKDLEEAVLVAVEPAGRFDVQEREVQLAEQHHHRMPKLILWMKLGTKCELSWATFGHEHHDEAVRDAQAPAQASSEQPALVQAPASM